MSTLRKKLIVLLIAIFSIVILLIILTLIFFPFNNGPEQISEDIKEEILLYKEYIPKEHIERDLAVLNNKSASETERYDAFLDLFFNLENAYFNTGIPRIREFTFKLDKYARDNFKNKYKKEDFYIACADEICGEKTPLELENLMEEIKNLPIEKEMIDTINFNIRTASHIPNNSEFEKIDKINSFSISELILVSIGEEKASKSAEKLRNYVKLEYDANL